MLQNLILQPYNSYKTTKISVPHITKKNYGDQISENQMEKQTMKTHNFASLAEFR